MSTRRAPPLDRFYSPLRKRAGVKKWVLPRKDVVGPLASWTFYWDRHDEGVFIGNRGSGKGVHVDQVLWSNARASQMAVMRRDSQRFHAIPGFLVSRLAEVGKNWRGHKLVAAWPKGAVQDPGTNRNKKHINIVFLFNCDLRLYRQYFVSQLFFSTEFLFRLFQPFRPRFLPTSGEQPNLQRF